MTDVTAPGLEITLEGEGRLEEFKKTYKKLYPKKDWDKSKNLIAFAMNEAKRALVPIENKRQFLEVSGDIMEHVDPVFYGDPKAAAFKAWGMN